MHEMTQDSHINETAHSLLVINKLALSQHHVKRHGQPCCVQTAMPHHQELLKFAFRK